MSRQLSTDYCPTSPPNVTESLLMAIEMPGHNRCLINPNSPICEGGLATRTLHEVILQGVWSLPMESVTVSGQDQLWETPPIARTGNIGYTALAALPYATTAVNLLCILIMMVYVPNGPTAGCMLPSPVVKPTPLFPFEQDHPLWQPFPKQSRQRTFPTTRA